MKSLFPVNKAIPYFFSIYFDQILSYGFAWNVLINDFSKGINYCKLNRRDETVKVR